MYVQVFFCFVLFFNLIYQRTDRPGIRWMCFGPWCLHTAVCLRAAQHRPDSRVWAGEEPSECCCPPNPHGYLPRRRRSAGRSSSTEPSGRAADLRCQRWNKPWRRTSRDQHEEPWMCLWRIRIRLMSLFALPIQFYEKLASQGWSEQDALCCINLNRRLVWPIHHLNEV